MRHAIHAETTLYFQENVDSVTSHRSLWEAYKAVIRGAPLAKISGLRKEAQGALIRLEEQILELETSPERHESDTLQQHLKIKTKEYSELATEAARTHYRATRCKVYDVGDKGGKLLAWLDKKSQVQRGVTELEERPAIRLTDPQDIADAFGRHYKALYKTITPHTEEEALSLMRGIPLLSLTQEEANDLEAELTATEIETAILSLNSGKVSGLNGLPIELFKLVARKIAPHLVDMYEESRQVEMLPEDQRLANIVTIHKEGKPRHKCTSYRPISLLNCEAKILVKVLVTRLLTVVTQLVHPDQSGFMPARNTSLNIRRLNVVLSRASTIQEEAVIVSLDEASAFDTIEWPCMFAALCKQGFGPQFLSWIRLLYAHPLAKVVVNNRQSLSFELTRGTRQGCPLSPLLFALTLEPFAMWIRTDPLIRGLKWAQEWEDRISLYADDILLYLASPSASLHRALHIFRIFGRYSGYTINWQKSVLYVLHGDIPKLPRELDLAVATQEFKYLSIWASKDSDRYYSRNLLPPLQRLRSDVTHWKALPLNLMGRVALFKMMSLRRFLYALQNSPNLVPPTYFKEIEATIRSLLWDNKPPRIATRKLTLGWYDGGVGLPDIRKYYWAAHLSTINKCTFRPQDDPAFQMDRWLLPGNSFHGALYVKSIKPTLTSPTRHTVEVWKLATKDLGWTDRITKATPLWHADCLGNLGRSKGFDKWDQIGITRVGDLRRGGDVLPFQQLQLEYELSDREHF